MPIIVRLHYADNTNEIVRVPVDIWRSNGDSVSKLFVSEKEIVRMELDPFRETADTESSNNHWPPKLIPSRFKLYKSGSSDNEMRKANKKKEAAEKKAAKEAENAEEGDKESDEAVEDASGDNQSGSEADEAASSTQSSQ
jgi:hypothetical protein